MEVIESLLFCIVTLL